MDIAESVQILKMIMNQALVGVINIILKKIIQIVFHALKIVPIVNIITKQTNLNVWIVILDIL